MASVDVLIPTCGRPAALAVTLTALLGQTHHPLRVVVADQTEGADALDNREVQAIIRVLRVAGVPVEVHKNLPRRGLAQQRQFLLDHAAAPYVLFLDDDVIVEPDLVARLVRAIGPQGCGFVGSFVNAPSAVDSAKPIDEPPPDLVIEPWNGRVQPERVVPGSREWGRYRLHFAAYLHRLCERVGISRSNERLYKVAWVGGCVLFDADKLREVGGFEFWHELPRAHAGEDVVAQLRVMARFGGAALAPSGAWHQEVPTTTPDREVDAPLLLEAPATSTVEISTVEMAGEPERRLA